MPKPPELLASAAKRALTAERAGRAQGGESALDVATDATTRLLRAASKAWQAAEKARLESEEAAGGANI